MTLHPARSKFAARLHSHYSILTNPTEEDWLMLLRSVLSFLLSISTLLALSLAERPALAQAPASNPQAVSLLQQALDTSGMTVKSFRTFTANGTITYFWAGEAVEGAATIRARGGDQFRLDANMPDGARSVSTDRRGGSRKGPDGKLVEIPAHNTLTAGILTFPYPSIAAALMDANVTISYAGLVESGGRQLHQVRVARVFPEDADPEGILAKLAAVDYLIDSQTLLVVKTADLTHPKETLTESYTHEVEFEAYAAMSGVAVPTVVREKVGGQTIWEFHLSDINFNSNLTDADFSLQ